MISMKFEEKTDALQGHWLHIEINNVKEHNMVKSPNWHKSDQLAIYIAKELNLGLRGRIPLALRAYVATISGSCYL